MRIQTKPLNDLQPNNWNPNEMDDQRFESLVYSIKKHGVLQPILIREDGTIIKGEKRWQAACKAGLEEILCVVVERSDEEAKLLTISLSHLRGESNEEMLAGLIQELSVHFSLEEISLESGYTSDELDRLIEGLSIEIDDPDTTIEEDDFDLDEALESITEPETKYGQRWQLGRHILMCGDATNREDVDKLLQGRAARLIVTDPPYNVDFQSDSEKLGADGRASIMNDHMPMEQFEHFLHQIFSNYAHIMDEQAAIYVFHPSAYQNAFSAAMNQADIIIRTQCIWVKNAFSLSFAQYKFKHEPVFYAHLKGKAPRWYGDRAQTTVWDVSRGDVTKYVHPTQKPLELIAIPIKNSSQRDDLVVDYFGGSGSTLMTCEQLGRECRTMELDPKFCDVIKKRFFEATGIAPILLEDE